METIEDICKLYGVKSFVTDKNNLIGIRVKRRRGFSNVAGAPEPSHIIIRTETKEGD